MDNFQISDDFIERTKNTMKMERDSNKQNNFFWKKRSVLTLAGAATIMIVVGAVAVNNGLLSSQNEDTKIYTDQSQALESTTTSDGITIPEIQVNGGQKGISADMMGLFIYQGRVYTQSQTTLPMTDGVIDKTIVDALKGDFLGKTKSGIDEWSDKEAYTEDFASTIGESEIYTLKGYDSKYRLMVYTKYEEGYDCQIFDSFGGLQVITGADYFDKLQLKGRVSSLNWQSFDNWNNGFATTQTAPVDEKFHQFMDALYMAVPIGENSDFFSDKTAFDSQKFVNVTTEDQLTTSLRLFKDGYVYANGVGFFRIDNPAFHTFYESLPVSEGQSGNAGVTDGSGGATAEDTSLTDISVAMKDASYPAGVDTITMIITNQSENEYYYGVDYKIEKLEGTSWKEVPGVSDLAFIEIAVVLPANTSQNFDMDLSTLRKNMSAGNYRVIKNINGTDFTTEFELTK